MTAKSYKWETPEDGAAWARDQIATAEAHVNDPDPVVAARQKANAVLFDRIARAYDAAAAR